MLSNDDLQKIGQLVTNSEKRTAQKITDSEKFVISEVGKFIEDHIFTQLEEKADEKDLKHLSDRVTILEQVEHIV